MPAENYMQTTKCLGDDVFSILKIRVENVMNTYNLFINA